MSGIYNNRNVNALKTNHILIILMLFFIINSCKKEETKNDESETNDIELPVVKTDSLTKIFITTARGGGNVISDGGGKVQVRGVCYSVTPNPTIANSKTENGFGTGSFISYLDNLQPNTTYYIRAYASNQKGIAYGNELQFVTQEEAVPITDIDGNVYPTVLIGSKVWMAKDLRVTHYPNGDPIPNVTDNTTWQNLNDNNIDDAYCFYNNDSNTDYGALYTYAAAIGDNWERDNSNINSEGGQGICPDGWHLPTNSEWLLLRNYLNNNTGENTFAGGEMKETGFTHWNYPNTGATNNTGFTAIPGGKRKENDASFNGLGNYVIWWSASEYFFTSYCWTVGHDHPHLNQQIQSKSNAFSVRCVRD